MAISSGAIAGFVIAAVISFLYLLCLVYYLCTYRSKRGPSYDAENLYSYRRTRSEAAAHPAIEEQRRLDSHEAQKEFSENVHGHELVNHGSMQAKGVAIIREDRDLGSGEKVA
jgi:hypothetical protein